MSDVSGESIEWLNRPRHTVWLDQDLLVGDGDITEIAPDSFMSWDDGLERVRFGKLIGLSGGAEQAIPIIPELLQQVVAAADQNCAEAVFVEEIGDRSPQDLWLDFFSSALNDAKNIIAQPILRNEEHKTKVEYVMSIIDPRPQARFRNLYESRFDKFDVVSFIGYGSQRDQTGRIETAKDIKEHFIDHKPLTHAEMEELKKIRTRTLGYLTFSQ